MAKDNTARPHPIPSSLDSLPSICHFFYFLKSETSPNHDWSSSTMLAMSPSLHSSPLTALFSERTDSTEHHLIATTTWLQLPEDIMSTLPRKSPGFRRWRGSKKSPPPRSGGHDLGSPDSWHLEVTSSVLRMVSLILSGFPSAQNC